MCAYQWLAVAVQNCLMVFGGSFESIDDDDGYSNSLYVFDFETMSWSIPLLPNHLGYRRGHMVTSHNDHLIVAGGESLTFILLTARMAYLMAQELGGSTKQHAVLTALSEFTLRHLVAIPNMQFDALADCTAFKSCIKVLSCVATIAERVSEQCRAYAKVLNILLACMHNDLYLCMHRRVRRCCS